ncbi:hypothetical protein PR003_g34611 [Phytophthora rubi]|uniref:Uncharacterized protein n=1 Tax=Phytophthora rubi TaxID=129364 RepID=A0A6A3G5Y9_9STRA|nr:hypothetical protein PR001_g33154 [Phytophthora rubi]KAE8953855.1 hypothetical protein PR002_g32251 [Phytophthora rubi]KAE9259839.1 hypothetical protein PR003_g34611 [Phytophthora rubi]
MWSTLVWAATTTGFGIGTGPGIRPLDWYWFWEKLCKRKRGHKSSDRAVCERYASSGVFSCQSQ